jgi:SAM-dependent methyltransferase
VSRWSSAQAVAGFVHAAPNERLLQFANQELTPSGSHVLLDIGCGAARNALPLAASGWTVVGTDTSRPMLDAASQKARAATKPVRIHVVEAAMDALPVADGAVDLLVAHGIWNLARSGDEFRRAVAEAARVARPGAGLFLFTFSRNTLPADCVPVDPETFVFTQFAGEPQCFLSADEIVAELGAVGFLPDPAMPLRELNRPTGAVRTISGPVIYEGAFRLASPAPGHFIAQPRPALS